jgi:hypothetical protein
VCGQCDVWRDVWERKKEIQFMHSLGTDVSMKTRNENESGRRRGRRFIRSVQLRLATWDFAYL